MTGPRRELAVAHRAQLAPDEQEASRAAAMLSAADTFFLDPEKLIWRWPDSATRLIEELR